MRSFTIALGLASAFLTHAVHAQQGRLPNPITNPGAPWAFWGFVVNAPDAPDILSQAKSPVRAVSGKKLPEPDHTVAFTVATQKLEKAVSSAEALVAHLKVRRARNFDPTRFRLVEHNEEVFALRDYWCTRYSLVSEDRGVRLLTPVALVLEGITCVHPDRKDLAVDVRYSERGAGKTASPEVREVGEKFIRGLRFIPLPDRPEITSALEALRAKEGDKALNILKPLLERDDTQAALIAGEIYLSGHGAPVDHARARQMLEIAARDGHGSALFNLGAIYDRGLGVARDPVEAVKWFKLAADQRHDIAQFNLAVLYNRGDGVPRDPVEAAKWARRAADNGNERARGAIGRQ
jgi:hypothetical protein